MRPSDIRKHILKQRGVEFKRLSRKPVPIEDTPSIFKKTILMRLTELRFKNKLENLIFTGTIYEAGKRLEVDPTTIYGWRKIVNEARNKEFFDQFK